MTTQKASYDAPVSDEAIVDHGIGTLDEQDAAYRRIEARRERALYEWMARPLWQRTWIRLRHGRRWLEARRRAAHVVRAARGVECEP